MRKIYRKSKAENGAHPLTDSDEDFSNVFNNNNNNNNNNIIIIIFINCNWVVTRWQWLFYMYKSMKKSN